MSINAKSAESTEVSRKGRTPVLTTPARGEPAAASVYVSLSRLTQGFGQPGIRLSSSLMAFHLNPQPYPAFLPASCSHRWGHSFSHVSDASSLSEPTY